MKKYIAYYYLMFVLLIFGAFASMAQNDYGLKILGVVSFVFALLFIVQLISGLTSEKKIQPLEVVELVGLVILSSVLGMRVYYIHFQFVEILFAVAGVGLIGVYLLKLVMSWNTIRVKNNGLAISVCIFYASIISYITSMTMVPFFPGMAEPAGTMGFALIIIFVVVALVKKKFMVDGEKVSAFRFVYRFRDRSPVLIALFILFTGYMGLTKVGAIPKIYSDEFPQSYFELVNRAESGNEEALEGKYSHEEFMERYNEFVNRHVNSGSK